MRNRELSVKELNKIMEDVGKQVRIQSKVLKDQKKENMQREIESARNRKRAFRPAKA